MATEGGFKITIGERSFLLKLEQTMDPRVLIAQFGDKPVNISLESADNQGVTIMIEGERLSFRRPSAATRLTTPARPTVAVEDTLAAPMPGRIIGILANEGDEVRSGAPLVIIESMKMETVIRSDREATIDRVLVADGSTVRRGEALVRFRR